MPIIKSAIKRSRQEKKRNAYNVGVKTDVRTKVKVVRAQITSGSVKDNKALIAAIAELDRAVKKGVLHKRTAARKKSRLTNEYNKVAKTPFGTENPGKPGNKAKKVATKKPVAKKAPAKKVAKPKAKAAPKKPAA